MRVYAFDVRTSARTTIEVHARNEDEAYEKAQEKVAELAASDFEIADRDTELECVDEHEYCPGEENI